VVGAAITGGFNYVSHQGDIDAKMIELSMGILRAEPKLETAPLREWAIDVIDKRANFKFTDTQRALLLQRQLPYQGVYAPLTGRTLRELLDTGPAKRDDR
jgi:hypothetical protein